MTATAPSSEAALIAQGKPYAMRLAAVFCGRFRALDRDGIESDAMLGLLNAARTFDSSRHDRFPSFARKRIVGEILEGIKREAKHQLLIKEVGEFAAGAIAPDDPAASAAIRDEADFVRAKLVQHRHAHSGNRRLSATAIAACRGISVSAAAHRLRTARKLIEGSFTCAN